MGIAPIPFLIVLLWLIAYGPGRISADRMFFRRLDTGPLIGHGTDRPNPLEPAPARWNAGIR